MADFAVGYQYRAMRADGNPNDAGDATLNPCSVAGDAGCAAGDRFGPYLFTNIHRPYDADQQVQRFFGEVALSVGPRVDTQIAANYEFYNVAGRHVSSFDPKIGGRLQVAENQDYSLALRGSVQTTFRTPSLDDLNLSPLTTLEWISETGAYQAVDRFGRPDLLPEQAFTYNVGAVLFLEGSIEADGRLLELRLRERDRLDALRCRHQPLQQRTIRRPRRPCRHSSSVREAGPRT